MDVNDRRAYQGGGVKGKLVAVALVCLAVLGLLGCGANPADSTQPPSPRVKWVELRTSGARPPDRTGHAMIYEVVTGRLLLFGGWAEALTLGVKNDMWAFDRATNTWLELDQGAGSPAPRERSAMVQEPTSGVVFLFGGSDGTRRFADTWAYRPATNVWTEFHPMGDIPAARSGHAMSYDRDTGTILMFGGRDNQRELNDTWAYSPVANEWHRLDPSGGLPAGRVLHAMVYVPSIQKLILFGGRHGSAALDDTWVYDPVANAWAELAPESSRPNPRFGHSMVWHEASGRVILFGGVAESQSGDGHGLEATDTWLYDPVSNTWAEAELAEGAPGARDGQSMVYDPAQGVVVLFGGWDGIRAYGDLWTCGVE